jgi:dihydrofolate reductase
MPRVCTMGSANIGRMRKIIVQQWATVDNIVAEEDGGLSFVSGEPFDDNTTSPFQDSVMAFIDSVDTMILGANTYNMSVGYWPTAEDQGVYGKKVNALNKFVASTTLEEAPWGEDWPAATVTADPVATIKDLKKKKGKDIWVWGSLTLVRSLFEAGVVDEVQMRVCPATRGKGTRFFESSQNLEVIEATSFDTGVVLLRYAVKK